MMCWWPSWLDGMKSKICDALYPARQSSTRLPNPSGLALIFIYNQSVFSRAKCVR